MKLFSSPIAGVLAGILFAGTGALAAAAVEAKRSEGVGRLALRLVRSLGHRRER